MASFFSRLSKAVGFGRARYYIGKDLENNKYYEFPALDGSTDPRKTRRIIRYREHRELGEHNQGALAAQWLMWLRHTRRSAPTIEELVADQERIETTRHNARILEQRDAERKLYLEQQAEQETNSAQQQQQQQRPRLEPSTSATAAATSPSNARHHRATAVPTSSVSEEGAEQDQQRRRNVDMEVWEASRRRVEEKSAQQEDAFSRRSQRRAELDHRDAERSRARQAMSQSPLAAFDVSYEDDSGPASAASAAQALPQEAQLKPRFGRAVGPGEQWSPKEWSPAPAARKR